jgi:DNA-binding transcriptional regulator YiaG
MRFRYKTCERCNGSGVDIDDHQTGQAVKECRESKGASLRKVAMICNWSAAYLSDLERGNRRWNKEKMDRVMKAIESFGGIGDESTDD